MNKLPCYFAVRTYITPSNKNQHFLYNWAFRFNNRRKKCFLPFSTWTHIMMYYHMFIAICEWNSHLTIFIYSVWMLDNRMRTYGKILLHVHNILNGNSCSKKTDFYTSELYRVVGISKYCQPCMLFNILPIFTYLHTTFSVEFLLIVRSLFKFVFCFRK